MITFMWQFDYPMVSRYLVKIILGVSVELFFLMRLTFKSVDVEIIFKADYPS